LRTQQLIAFETGVANVADPLGGSWYVEELTNQIEEKAENYFKQIEELGGVVEAIEQGFQQREIAEASSAYQKLIEDNHRYVVGVNEFVKEDEELDIPILEIGGEIEDRQVARLKETRETRDQADVTTKLNDITAACKEGRNVMQPIILAAKSYATVGEIVDAMKIVFGEWQETSVI